MANRGEIKVGTLVMVVKTAYPEMFGKTGECIGVSQSDSIPYYICQFEPNERNLTGVWGARRDYIVPITPDDDTLTEDDEINHPVETVA